MEKVMVSAIHRDLDRLVVELFKAVLKFNGTGGQVLAERLRTIGLKTGGAWLRFLVVHEVAELRIVFKYLSEGKWVIYIARRCGYCESSVYKTLARRFERLEGQLKPLVPTTEARRIS